MIKAVNIKKSFGDHEVLKGVDLTLEKGKVNMIIGKSGTGKESQTHKLLQNSYQFDGWNELKFGVFYHHFCIRIETLVK